MINHHEDKTTASLANSQDANNELETLRRRVAELEALEATRRASEEALAQERHLLRTLIDNLPDYIYFKDTESRFVIGNVAVARGMGAETPDDLVGKTDFDFYPYALADRYYADEQAVLASGHPLINREEPVLNRAEPKAEKRWLSTTKVPLRDGQGRIFGLVGVGRDITALKRTEAMLAQRAAQLAMINDIGSKIAAVLELETLLDRAARLVQETFGYHHVALFLLEGQMVKLKAIAGSYQAYFPANHTQKLSEGIIGWVATHGEKIVANDVSVELRYISLIPDRTETRAELCLPIKVAGQTVGVLNIQSPELHAFGENDFIAMEILTNQIAVAIENARLYQAVQQELTERKQAEAELSRYRDHLEELVAERTAKLQAANEQLQQEIAERKRAEQALRESESKYRLLMEQASDGILITDQRGNCLEVNPRICEMLGYTRVELLRYNFQDLVPTEDLAITPLHFAELKAGKTILIERRLHCRNKKQLQVEISARMLDDGRVQAIVRDITERKQAEAALQRYAERLKTLQEIDRSILSAQSPEAIAQAALRHMRELIPCIRAEVVEFDSRTGKATILATYVNGETGRRQVAPLLSPELSGTPAELEQRQIQGEPESWPALLRTEAQPAKTLRSYIKVPLIAQGKLIGTLNLEVDRPGAFTAEHVDIAREVADPLAVAIQQARLHEQVQRHATELEQRVIERTAKLEEINAELNSFSYSVSHDLRAPLRAVQGFADALLEDYGAVLDSMGQEYAQRIVAAAQRMDTLVQDLLTYSRLSRIDLRLEPIHLTSVMADVLAQLEAEIQGQAVELSVSEPLPQVMGHHSTIVQIVANLLTNAIKFVAPGSQPHVRVWAEERAEQVRLWVEDNGIGIEPEHQERIFQIFERLHGIETYPGTGVGLAIVRKGAARMGGRAGVESALGQGSKFWVELPRVGGSG